jgi:hypothetical protein
MKQAKVKRKRKQTQPQPGPKPDLLKIDMDWHKAIKKSLEKKKPAGGWPK